MAEIWGYARVSTADQNPALQIDALKAAGVPANQIVVEQVSGAAAQRPKFEALTARLERGDTLHGLEGGPPWAERSGARWRRRSGSMLPACGSW